MQFGIIKKTKTCRTEPPKCDTETSYLRIRRTCGNLSEITAFYILRGLTFKTFSCSVSKCRFSENIFFHEQLKRHRLTFFSYHLFKTCNSCPVTQENVTFMLMLLYSHNGLSMCMLIAQMNFLFFMNACQ